MSQNMHALVRDLYKRIVLVGRDYPLGLDWVRSKAKPWFRQHSDATDEVEIKKLVGVGRHQVREMQAVIQLKKYRHLRRAYGTPAEEEISPAHLATSSTNADDKDSK
ncbi:hypothetical protein BASA81_006878 [Batrachochytrium salamandrivorans]|nr:hypothetical protein BASA81_006878 [Batrachochytrium salamandrivorans]